MGRSQALKGLTVMIPPRPRLFLSVLTSFSSDSGGICDFPPLGSAPGSGLSLGVGVPQGQRLRSC